VTDRYDYDAFGVIISSAGSTPNDYLYVGERLDSGLGLYYYRMRYYGASAGRLWSMDPAEGIDFAPITLHKYLYANADPVDNIDPTGTTSISDINLVVAVLGNLSSTFLAPGRFIERLVERFLYCGVNPITNRAGIVAACTGVIGQLRPGVAATADSVHGVVAIKASTLALRSVRPYTPTEAEL